MKEVEFGQGVFDVVLDNAYVQEYNKGDDPKREGQVEVDADDRLCLAQCDVLLDFGFLVGERPNGVHDADSKVADGEVDDEKARMRLRPGPVGQAAQAHVSGDDCQAAQRGENRHCRCQIARSIRQLVRDFGQAGVQTHCGMDTSLRQQADTTLSIFKLLKLFPVKEKCAFVK